MGLGCLDVSQNRDTTDYKGLHLGTVVVNTGKRVSESTGKFKKWRVEWMEDKFSRSDVLTGGYVGWLY